MAEHLAKVGANGAVMVGRRWKNLGSQLDLRPVAMGSFESDAIGMKDG
jgi:hypothetical protein